MEFKKQREFKDKILKETIGELEKRLHDKQLELAKLYEGDNIRKNVQSQEELELRDEIMILDRTLLKMKANKNSKI